MRTDRPSSRTSDVHSSVHPELGNVKFDENEEMETMTDTKTFYPSITPGWVTQIYQLI